MLSYYIDELSDKMSFEDIKNVIDRYLKSGDGNELSQIKGFLEELSLEGLSEFFKADQLFFSNKNYRSRSSLNDKYSTLFKLFLETYNKKVKQREKKCEALLEEQKKYIKEIEKTSRLMGRQNLVLSYFYQAGQLLSSSLDSDRIIPAIAEMVNNVFNDCFCCLYTVDDEGRLKIPVQMESFLPDFYIFFNNKIHMYTGEGCEGTCVNEQIPCQVFDVYSDERYLKFTHLADMFNFQSVLSVPLIIRGNAEGCISIYSYEQQFFPEEEVQILSLFADQAARAIENARLYQKTDKKLQIRVQELSLMHRMDQAIINNEKISQLAAILMEGIERIAPAFGFALELSRVEPGLVILNKKFEEFGISGETIDEFTADIIGKDRIKEIEITQNDESIHLIGFPINYQEDGMGAFWIATSGEEKAGSELIKFSEWILAQLSIAIEKSHTLEQLIHAEKMNVLGSLLSGIAHELNNPLGRILGLAETIKEDSDWKTSLASIEIIKTESLRCKRIMEDFLAFARKYKASRTPADINNVLLNTIQLWKYQKKTEDMKIVTEFEENLPPVRINVNRIQQVFLNLIVNAYDALNSSANESKRLKIATRRRNGHIRVIFEDNGPGIRKEYLEKIFQPFFTTKEKGKGTGLGLSLSRDIVKEHNGNIWAERAPTSGTRFVLELEACKDCVIKQEKDKPVEKVNFSGSKILVADDDAVILKLMTMFLRQEGYRVDTAKNGKECIEHILREDYDVIFSDMIMPDIRGFMLIHQIKSVKPHLLNRIVLCTGDIIEGDKLNELETNGIQVLYKPFQLDELKKATELVLANSRKNLSKAEYN